MSRAHEIETAPAAAGEGQDVTTAKDARFAFVTLLFVALFNHIDRTIVSILQDPIKRDLGLSDTQLGMMTGLAFALFYAFLALPVSRIADRVVRKYFMAGALTLWSLMTALSGFATNYATLLLLRMGVALGESSCSPTTLSLFSDYFPMRKRGTPIAIWAMTVPIGTSVALVGGGWVAGNLGWRNAFIVAGVLGLALAPVLLFMKEPRRGQFDTFADDQPTGPPPFREAVRILWELKTFRYILTGGTFAGFLWCALQYWGAPFYGRAFGLPVTQVAMFLVVLFGVGGALGAFLGGFLADILARRDRRWYGWLPALSTALMVPFAFGQFLAPTPYLSLASGFVCTVLLSMYLAPMNTVSQSLVRSNMRAFTSAMTLVVVNIVSLGLGPTFTGIVSDILIARGHETDSLRYALSACVLVSLPAVGFFLLTARNAPRELPPDVEPLRAAH